MSRPVLTTMDCWHLAGREPRQDGCVYTSRAVRSIQLRDQYAGRVIPLSPSELWRTLDVKQGPFARDLPMATVELACAGAWGPLSMTSYMRIARRELDLMRDPSAPFELLKEKFIASLWAQVEALPSYRAWQMSLAGPQLVF